MKILGLTGSIGMGKTTVGEMFARLGVPVHDSDHAAHTALEEGSPVFTAIAKTFPESWCRKTRTIDRKKLGAIVFADPEQKTLLESFIHPYVQAQQLKFLSAMRAKGMKNVVLDIPLLFETRAEQRVDHTIVVSAPFFIQTQRVLARPNMTVERFNSILRAQMSDTEKQERSDFIVQTGLGMARTQQQVRAILHDIQH